MNINYNNDLGQWQLYFASAIYTVDQNGLVYIVHRDSPETLHIYESTYEFIQEIDLKDILQMVHFTNNKPLFKRGSVWSLFITDEGLIVLGLTDNLTVVINRKGEVLKTHVTYVRKENENANANIKCHYSQLRNGQILVRANSQFRGNMVAISKEVNPDFLGDDLFETIYLTDTFVFPEHVSIDLVNMERKEKSLSIGLRIKELKEKYWQDKNPNKVHINFSSQYDIYQTIEINDETLMAHVVTDCKSKSHQPNKNMPYFGFFIGKNTGEILKEISLPDRSFYKKNLLTRIIKYRENQYLFKTHDSTYLIDNESTVKELLSLEGRKFSAFRGFRIIGSLDNRIHFAVHDTGEMVNYEFGDDFEKSVGQMLKEYRAIRKNK